MTLCSHIRDIQGGLHQTQGQDGTREQEVDYSRHALRVFIRSNQFFIAGTDSLKPGNAENTVLSLGGNTPQKETQPFFPLPILGDCEQMVLILLAVKLEIGTQV